ncbi:hypothetical protein D9599_23440 [Roseomonas sp. KE2513]|uniref:hypothetical protein n=1 Tax=Roseomonas sp. KE2513 TaxID=2479202 RepID=UPI0018E04D70|nr:hypothetical protein [Roseomonas sp. KE2513]MBI0538519.1 hypothetical protein [Roseomonas sp. KE2513]
MKLSQAFRRQPSRVLVCSAAALLLAAPAALAQGTAGNSPIWNGRQHQPTRGETEQRLRQDGTPSGDERERGQLRELNELSRELLPPGSTEPAPEAERTGR